MRVRGGALSPCLAAAHGRQGPVDRAHALLYMPFLLATLAVLPDSCSRGMTPGHSGTGACTHGRAPAQSNAPTHRATATGVAFTQAHQPVRRFLSFLQASPLHAVLLGASAEAALSGDPERLQKTHAESRSKQPSELTMAVSVSHRARAPPRPESAMPVVAGPPAAHQSPARSTVNSSSWNRGGDHHDQLSCARDWQSREGRR